MHQHKPTTLLCVLLQPKFFGLKYRARRSPPLRRWLDLDRPLKKQLDRFAESKYLHLGVMFYVSDIAALQDEMTRSVGLRGRGEEGGGWCVEKWMTEIAPCYCPLPLTVCSAVMLYLFERNLHGDS